MRCGVRLNWFNTCTCDEKLLSLRLAQNRALNLKNTWNNAHFMGPIFLTGTHKIIYFSDSGSGTADYIAKMWYFRIYFSLQMWFFSDTGMVWYVWDMCYAIMRCILKWFYHVSNQSAENRSWSITPSFTLVMLAEIASDLPHLSSQYSLLSWVSCQRDYPTKYQVISWSYNYK